MVERRVRRVLCYGPFAGGGPSTRTSIGSSAAFVPARIAASQQDAVDECRVVYARPTRPAPAKQHSDSLGSLARPYDRALHALRSWLDSWSGIGHVAVGMAHQGYDLQLTRYDERGWRATFYTTGMEHSPTSATGTGWERTPWHATQRAAWEALRNADG